MREKILVVDDEPEMRALMSRYLEQSGYAVCAVCAVADGRGAREFLRNDQASLILLDLKLPDVDGLELAREIRASSRVPIIMLTGIGTEVDRVVGLELAADDYLSKPISLRELLARIKAVMRRYDHNGKLAADEELRNQVYFADWTLDLTRRELISADGKQVKLTTNEFNLLTTFIRHAKQVLTRDQLLELSRTDSADVFDRTVDYQVLQLRRKLEKTPSRPELIKTEWGAGYIFCPEVHRHKRSQS